MENQSPASKTDGPKVAGLILLGLFVGALLFAICVFHRTMIYPQGGRCLSAHVAGISNLFSNVGVPEGIVPVTPFDATRYLGKWHEIARLDHSFERGLTQVTADYRLRDGGGIAVVNRGYDAARSKWKESAGRAYFVGPTDVGHLKVSFFGPFFGSYVVFALDHQNYQFSMVTGPNRSYLWILSRAPQMNPAIFSVLVNHAESLGFDTSKLLVAR